ncbi:condensation domain-containing protein [Streptomyces sp. NPDC058398]|uniref:condensation domain-containing protein n=1 Tax=Streptomyces sp. NPDC058398 TaxID=3346479 RepID=UPI003668442F
MTPTTTFPLTAPQREVWRREALTPRRSRYNNPLAVRLTGPLDVALLADAVSAVVARHPLLSAVVDADGDEPRLREDGRPGIVRLERDDSLAGGAPSAQDIDDELRRYAREPFDLIDGPLFRARVYHLGDDDHVLHLVAHHLIADGTSIELIAADTSRAYDGLAATGEAGLEPPGARYADFAEWYERRLQGPDHREELAEWADYLGDVPLGLPVARRAPKSGRTLAYDLRVADAAALREAAAWHRGTLFVLALTSLQCALRQHTGHERFSVFVPFSGRTEPEFADVVGYFVNVLPVRAVVPGDADPLEVFRANAHSLPDLLDRQLVPGGQILGATATPPARATPYTARVLLNIRPPRSKLFADAGLHARVVLGEPVVGYDLSLVAQEEDNALVWEIRADPAVFPEPLFHALVSDFTAGFGGIDTAAPPAERHAPTSDS